MISNVAYKIVNKKLVIVLALTTVALGGLLGLAIWSGIDRSNQLAAIPIVAEVHITENGFVPAELVVKPGTKVVWVNDTAAPRRVGANPYPALTQLPELDSGIIAPEGSFSFTFAKTGTIGYSDYTSPERAGSVHIK
jgi:plastocyanin